jgi:Uma2 family endonuclease
MSAPAAPGRATPDDLSRYEGKVELINGRIMQTMGTSDLPSEVAQNIYVSLRAHRLAVEVRSENDHGRAAEAEMAAKRADYFEAGTLVVWDVDPVAEVVNVYKADAPDRPIVYRRGDVAEAEPAVPGWRIAVDDVFAS